MPPIASKNQARVFESHSVTWRFSRIATDVPGRYTTRCEAIDRDSKKHLYQVEVPGEGRNTKLQALSLLLDQVEKRGNPYSEEGMAETQAAKDKELSDLRAELAELKSKPKPGPKPKAKPKDEFPPDKEIKD